MRAGSLRHTVELQERATTLDSRGQVAETWTTIGEVRCDVQTLSGREADLAKSLVASARHRVVMRHVDRATVGKRLVWRRGTDTVTLYIGHIANVGFRDHELHLLCSEDPD